MNLDPKRFPHAAEYLSHLPGGLESYPECRVKSDRAIEVLEKIPALKDDPDVPELLRRFLRGEHKDDWFSEVAGCTLRLMARDVAFSNDDDFLRWAFDDITRVFSKPWYRVVMYLLSPTLVVLGATKKWSTFHVGSTLVADKATPAQGRMTSRGVLTFPRALFTPLLIRQFGQSFSAALVCGRAKDVKVDVEESSDTRAVYLVSWLS